MSIFNAKMHQMRFLHLAEKEGAYSTPQSLAGFNWNLVLRGGRGGKVERKWKWGKGKGRREARDCAVLKIL